MNQRDIFVRYGRDPKKMVVEILTQGKIEEEISDDQLIGIKPNLVVSQPAPGGATTTPQIIAGIIEYLQSKGKKNMVILEGSWVGDSTKRAFKACGYEDLSKRYNVPLIDTQKDSYQSYDAGDGVRINVCDEAMKIGYMINVPVLKGHCQTRMTCALKNMKGCIPNQEKRKFHTMGLHTPIAYLNKVLKTDLVVVDGLNGDLTFEEGGNPVQMDRIILGKDPVLIDTYVAELMGYTPKDVPYIELAQKLKIGEGNLDQANIVESGKKEGSKKIKVSRRVQQLSKNVIENQACSACYGTLIHALDRLDEKGKLSKQTKIYIGQGYKGQKIDGIGCGTCTGRFSKNIPGCPPRGKDIVEFLTDKIGH